jgi:adenosyl cobinamide kinase/adenosyl cobinamide phosphate guanylyltransferase
VPILPLSGLVLSISGSFIAAGISFSILMILSLIAYVAFGEKRIGLLSAFQGGWYIGLGVLIGPYVMSAADRLSFWQAIMISEVRLMGSLGDFGVGTIAAQPISPVPFIVMLLCMVAGVAIEALLNSKISSGAPVEASRAIWKERLMFLMGGCLLLISVAGIVFSSRNNRSPSTASAQSKAEASDTMEPYGSTGQAMAGMFGAIAKMDEIDQRIKMAKTSEEREKAELEKRQMMAGAVEQYGEALGGMVDSLGRLAEANQLAEMRKTPEQRQAERAKVQQLSQVLEEVGKHIPASSLRTDAGRQGGAPEREQATLGDAFGALGRLIEAEQEVEITKSTEQRQAELEEMRKARQSFRNAGRSMTGMLGIAAKLEEIEQRIKTARTPEEREQAELEKRQQITQAWEQSAKTLDGTIESLSELADASEKAEIEKTPEQRQAELKEAQQLTHLLEEIGKLIPAPSFTMDSKQRGAQEQNSVASGGASDANEEKTKGASTESYSESSWRYSNKHFGFTLGYPDILMDAGDYQDGAGRRFQTKNGEFQLSVFGQPAGDETAPLASKWNEILQKLRGTITYKRKAARWFVVSGRTLSGNEYYYKVFLKSGNLIYLKMDYPGSKNAIYDPLVERITKDFSLDVNSP